MSDSCLNYKAFLYGMKVKDKFNIYSREYQYNDSRADFGLEMAFLKVTVLRQAIIVNTENCDVYLLKESKASPPCFLRDYILASQLLQKGGPILII